MKRLSLCILAMSSLLVGAASADTGPWYVLVPTIQPGKTATKVEMLRSNLLLRNVRSTYIAEGTSGVGATPVTLKAYIGPSTSTKNPLLDLTPITPSGGMVILEPDAGLDAVEVSLEIEASPIRSGWKLPLLKAGDFFAAGTTAYVLNLVKQPDAASNLQVFNLDRTSATCDVELLRPDGSVRDTRPDITVPALGVVRIPDILRLVTPASAGGLKAAVTCNTHFYALGALPATNRWNTRVEFPVAQLPGKATAVTLDKRSGLFFRVTRDNSDLEIPVNLDPNIDYRTLTIDFDIAIADPPDFVVFRNVIGMYRLGGRRFGKTLYFGSFENFDAAKYVVDLGTPYIETTVKRIFSLVGGRTYHFSIALDNDQQTMRYLITQGNGASTVMDLLTGLYNRVEVVDGQAPVIELGLPGVADNAYFPPYGWRYSNLNIVATK